MKKLLLLILVAGCAREADMRSDWERRNLPAESAPEEALATPAYPVAARLVEVPVANGGSFRYYVDPASLSAGRDGIVRYTVVARSPAGSENVFYEGLRCMTRHYRVYAFGRSDGTWGGRQGDWQPLAASTMQPWRTVLFRDYFCPHSDPVRTAAEGVRALERGGHPSAGIER